MTRMKLCWALVVVWLMVSGAAVAQVSTTTVSDTLYHADGTPAQGTLLISWPQFTTASGAAVSAGSTTVTLNSGGGLSVALAPNAGSDPIGSYYTVVYHLDDGTLTRENWMVPVSGSAVHLTAVRSTVMPTSVAMQTVTKAYVDSVIASTLAANSIPPAVSLQSVLASSPFLMNVSGCQDNGGNGFEGLVFQSASTDGTPTCNGYMSTDGEGTLYGEDVAGDENIALEGSSGIGVFGGVVRAAGFNANNNKLINLADGSAATDAAAFEQIPVGASASVAGIVKLASGQTSTTLAAVATTGSASDIGGGTLADGRLSSNVPLLNAANAFSAEQTIHTGTGIDVQLNLGFSSGFQYEIGRSTATGYLDIYGTQAGANGAVFTGVDGIYATLRPTGNAFPVATTFGSSGQATVDASGNITTSGRIAPQQATPVSSSAACVAGQMWTDAGYIYVCTGTNTIGRAALSSF